MKCLCSKNSVLWVAINTKKNRNGPKRHRILKDREDTEKDRNDTEKDTYTYLISGKETCACILFDIIMVLFGVFSVPLGEVL